MRSERPVVPCRFGWIEDFVLPLATSGMEAQSIGLLLGLFALVLSGSSHTAPLGGGGAALVLLGLAWLARLLEAWELRGLAPQVSSTLSILGWLVALGAVALPYLPVLLRGYAIPQVLGSAVVATWAWQRGVRQAQRQWEYEELQADFKVSLAIIIGVLLLAGFTDPRSDLIPQFALALPVFFLCGLLAVSLARLAALRRSRAERQADPTRLWLAASLTLVSVLVAAALTLEALVSLPTLQAAINTLGPVGQALGTVASWLLTVFAWLLTPVFLLISWLLRALQGGSSRSSPPSSLTGSPQPTPVTHPIPPAPSSGGVPQAVVVGVEIAFIVLVVLVIMLLATRALRRLRDHDIGEGIEDQREGLNPLAELRQRRRHEAHYHAVKSAEERLDPQSVRARYREVLRAAQAASPDLARRADETPSEYETRILAYLTQHGQESAEDAALIDALTRAYRAERYGEETISAEEREVLRVALPGLIARVFALSATRRRH